jgi:tripeptidyl-peptidase-1
VISTSYGYNEVDLTAIYEQRQRNEYMKLGLAGVSVLHSSGDYGGECCVFPGCEGGWLNAAVKELSTLLFPGPVLT